MTTLLGSMMAAGKKTPEPAAKTKKKKRASLAKLE